MRQDALRGGKGARGGAGGSGASLAGLSTGLPGLLIWVPPFALAILVAVLARMPDAPLHEPRLLLATLNLVFSTLVSVLVAVLAGGSFISGGPSALLLLGGGTLAFGVSSALAGVSLPGADRGSADHAVTVYNIGVSLAACGNLLGALQLVFPPRRRLPWQRWTALLVGYGGMLLMMGLVTWASAADAIPVFFVPGQGPTLLRQVVLGAAIAQFAAAAFLLLITSRRADSPFFRWYALGLAMIAIGLGGVLGIRSVGGLLNWAGRASQYVGGVYLLVAAGIAIHRSGGWVIPLSALRETHRRYTSLVDVCPDAILAHIDGRYVFANPAAARLFGAQSPEELLGKSALELLHPDYRLQTQQCIRDLGEGEPGPMREVKLLRLDGQVLDAEAIAVRVRYEGKPAMQVVLRDITQHKLLEQSLREREQFLASIYHGVEVAIVVVDVNWAAGGEPEFRFVSMNQTAQRWSGLPAEQVIGKRPQDVAGPDQGAAIHAHYAQAVREASPLCYEERVTFPTGSMWAQTTAVPLRDASGHIHRLVVTSMDIARRKRMELDLEEARQHAESANAAKDRFLAILSHELRTPLTPIFGVADLLEADAGLDADAREAVAIIRRNAEVEARLIDDLLDVTRIAHGKVSLDFQAADLHEKARQVAGMCQAEVTAKQLKLVLALEAPQHHVPADPARLQQILWNLLRNAVKFTPPGGTVTLRTALVAGDGGGDSAQDEHVRLSVTDTGVGIDPQILPTIFDAFEQGGQGTTHQFGGLGLGLTICKGLVEAHGGTIRAESRGRAMGATFTVEFPLCAQPPAEPASQGPREPDWQQEHKGSTGGQRSSILLVEDHADTARTMARMFSKAGYEPVIAGSMQAALQAAAERRFDLLVSDVGLPDGTGLELMQQLKQQYGLEGIALSGYGTDEDVRKSREAGFTEHLTKPVDAKRLFEVVRRMIDTNPG